MGESQFYKFDYWFNNPEHDAWDQGGENYYVNRFYEEIVMKLKIPENGKIVVLGTHNCVAFDKLCKFFGYDRCIGYDLHNPKNHPNVVVKNCLELGDGDGVDQIAFLHNDLGSFSTTPRLKFRGYEWAAPRMVDGGIILGNNNLNRAKVDIEHFFQARGFQNIHFKDLDQNQFDLTELSKTEVHNGREFCAIDGYMLSIKKPSTLSKY